MSCVFCHNVVLEKSNSILDTSSVELPDVLYRINKENFSQNHLTIYLPLFIAFLLNISQDIGLYFGALPSYHLHLR